MDTWHPDSLGARSIEDSGAFSPNPAIDIGTQSICKVPALSHERIQSTTLVDVSESDYQVVVPGIDPSLSAVQGPAKDLVQLSDSQENSSRTPVKHLEDATDLRSTFLPSPMISASQTPHNRLSRSKRAIDTEEGLEPIPLAEDGKIRFASDRRTSNQVPQEDTADYQNFAAIQLFASVTSPYEHLKSSGMLLEGLRSPDLGHHQHLRAEQTQASQSHSVMETPTAMHEARFEEWLLTNTSLKRTTLDNQASFQLGFTWDANMLGQDCHPKGSWELDQVYLESVGNNAFKLQFSWATQEKQPTCPSGKRRRSKQNSERPSKRQQVLNLEPEDNEYGVDRLLEKWGRNTFLVQWEGGETTWEERENISPDLIKTFESSFKGFGRGIEILKVQTFKQGTNRIKKYRVQWKAPGSGEKSWLRESQIDFNVYNGPKPWLI